MKHIVLMVILLVLLAMPVITHQVQPVAVNGLAVESPPEVAIGTDCLALKVEQAVFEKVLKDSNPHLSEKLTQWIVYGQDSESAADIWRRGEWLDNIGCNSL